MCVGMVAQPDGTNIKWFRCSTSTTISDVRANWRIAWEEVPGPHVSRRGWHNRGQVHTQRQIEDGGQEPVETTLDKLTTVPLAISDTEGAACPSTPPDRWGIRLKRSQMPSPSIPSTTKRRRLSATERLATEDLKKARRLAKVFSAHEERRKVRKNASAAGTKTSADSEFAVDTSSPGAYIPCAGASTAASTYVCVEICIYMLWANHMSLERFRLPPGRAECKHGTGWGCSKHVRALAAGVR